jgi:hemolysin activation/secretion protein/cell division septation protein DedD
MSRILFFIFVIFLMRQNLCAADPLSSGGQIRQIPPVPTSQKTIPEIRIEPVKKATADTAAHKKILVKSLRITGHTLYTEADLLALTGFVPGSEVTIPLLRSMAAKIEEYYHVNRYFVTLVYLPAQDILDGVVTLTVVEGRYGTITLHNRSTLSDNLAYSLLSGLNSGDVIASATLEHRLLLLSDLPGVEVTSTLVPGTSSGASDLIVAVTPGQKITGEVDADNAGNRYTGMYRVGAIVNLNNPAGFGDVASLRALTAGPGLNYARASYQAQTGKATIGIAYSILGYELGKEFTPLKATGTAQIMSIFGSFPLIRSRTVNLAIQLSYDDKTFQDRVDAPSTVTDKGANVLMIALHGTQRDTFAGGGQSGYSLTWSTGSIDIRTPAAHSYDAVTAHSNGPYNKIAYSLMRLQNVTRFFSLYAAITGQFAMKNLDVSEKMALGGMYAVRAYPEGEAYADQGHVLTLEARLRLPLFSENHTSQMHLIGLVDAGSVIINKNPWTTEPNSRTLSGAGIGLTWEAYRDFSVKAYYARKIGTEAATSGPASPERFWIQLVKFFGSGGTASPRIAEVKSEESPPLPSQPSAGRAVTVASPIEPTPEQITAKPGEETKKTEVTNPTPISSSLPAQTTPAVIYAAVSSGAESAWEIRIGTYAQGDLLEVAREQVRSAGFTPVVKTDSHTTSSMNRLFRADFTRHSDALTAYNRLKRAAPDAFILVKGSRYGVYSGSYLSDSRAAAELQRLNAAGFRLTLVRAEVALPLQRLTVGPFSSKNAATTALNKLQSAGIKKATSGSGRDTFLKIVPVTEAPQ